MAGLIDLKLMSESFLNKKYTIRPHQISLGKVQGTNSPKKKKKED